MPQRIDVPGMGVVEFPDGMTDDQITAAIKGNAPQQSSTMGDLAGIAKAGGIGIVKGAVGLAGLPGDLGGLLNKGIRYGTDLVGLTDKDSPKPDEQLGGSGQIRRGLEKMTGPLYEPKSKGEEYAQTIGEFAPGLIGGGGAGALARRAVTQVALPGAASEAAGQYTKGQTSEPFARIAGALAGGLAPSALGRLVTPLPTSEARQRLVNILNDEGVTSTTAGQRTGRPALRYAESVLGDYPGAGSQATRAQGEAQAQFTEAAMRRTGAGPDAGPEVLAANNRRLGNEFQTLAARNTLGFDQQFVQDATQAIRNYERVPPSQQRAVVEGYVNDITGHMQQGGMPGTYYQEMRSRLSRQANGLRNSDPTLSETLRDLRNSLDDAMRRSISPADREAWDTARQQYGAQKTIEKAASRAGEATAEGQIVPANLRNTAAAENRGAYARGEGQFSELSRAGAGVMGQMPQSGTAPRAAMTALAGGLGGAAGFLSGGASEANLVAALAAAGGPAVAGRALMSRPVQGYLGNQVASPMLNRLEPRHEALVNALLAADSERGPLRITVHPKSSR